MARRKPKAKRRRRIKRRPARVLPRSNKQRHRKPSKRPKSRSRSRKVAAVLRTTRARKRIRSDPRIEIAVREMNRGRSLTAAARSIGFPSKGLQTELRRQGLLKREGKHWVFRDDRPRKVVITTGGRSRTITVHGYDEASIAGAHQQAAKQFLRTNQLKFLQPFKGRTVQAANGRRYPLETDPNVVHRIAAMDTPPFHEIYEITSTT